jgi:flavin reductase (DIM6/NTAB) family NADH-FMN oxidoreductase RutF
MTQPQSPAQDEAPGSAAIAAALGRIPSGLFVVTWRSGAVDEAASDRGMLASWVMQGGFAPPLITIAVGTSRDLLAAIDQCSPFVVNVLAESQRPLVARFGKPAAPGQDPFDGLRVERTPSGAAALADSAAWLECRPLSQTGGGGGSLGDHVIVLARVEAAGTGADELPLVHTRRNGLRY